MKRPPATFLALAVTTLLVAGPAQAQQEFPVPMDREGRIEVVDARLAERLGIFTDRFAGFQEARLWLQVPDSTYILEVAAVREGRRLRERVPLSAIEADELRDDISRRIAIRAPATGVEREGRAALVGGATVLGLAFYGWAVPVMFDVDEATTATGLYMLTAGSAFFGPWMGTRNRSVTRGTAYLSNYGARRGILHGLLAHMLVTGGDEASDPDSDIRGEVASAMAFSVAEGLTGYAVARERGLDFGTTRTIGMAGDFGMLQGLGLALLTEPSDQAGAGLVLAGAAAGLALGYPIARRRRYSAGDVTVVSAAGYLGAYTGLALVDMFEPDINDGSDGGRWYAAGGMAGTVAGLLVGDRLVRPTEFSEGQGWLIALGTVAGGAVGLGGAYLLVGDTEDSGDSRVYLAASSVGAMAGYGITFRSLAPDAQRAESGMEAFDVQVNPVGAALALSGSAGRPGPWAGLPVLTGSIRF